MQFRNLPDRFRWSRAIASGLAIMFIIIAARVWWILFSEPQATDFLSYWSAARLALGGQARLAYDIEVHRAIELTVTPFVGMLPFPYPPAFLLAVTPFGLAPYPVGFALWVALTATLYLAAARAVAPRVYALAHPGVLGNVLIGQNGFLTSAIFIAGTAMLLKRPWMGGAILGAMVIKPQIALLIPLVLVAGREWRALGGTAISSGLLLVSALVLFGSATYDGFFRMAAFYASFLQETRWPWNELASPFAFARFFGIPQLLALFIHAAIAITAAGTTIRAWALNSSRRVPILAAATLLISPYLFTYDALLLMVPFGWFISRRIHPGIFTASWICCFLPVASYFDLYSGPNTVPVAALLCLCALHVDPETRCSADNNLPDRVKIG